MNPSGRLQAPDAGLALKRDRTAWLKGGDTRCLTPPPPTNGRVWRIILLGAPGIGKGTQGELLSERLGACHLSTGDVFRAAKCLADGELSPAMHAAMDYMHRGELVPDETVLNMVRERIRCLKCSGGFLLDGFPRTVAQAEALEKLLQQEGIPLDAVFDYDLPFEQIVARISGRRTCSRCKTVYHLTARPPKVAGLCDKCGGTLFQRQDDSPETIRTRMDAYEKCQTGLIDFYRKRGLLVAILAGDTPEETYQRTLEAWRAHQAKA